MSEPVINIFVNALIDDIVTHWSLDSSARVDTTKLQTQPELIWLHTSRRSQQAPRPAAAAAAAASFSLVTENRNSGARTCLTPDTDSCRRAARARPQSSDASEKETRRRQWRRRCSHERIKRLWRLKDDGCHIGYAELALSWAKPAESGNKHQRWLVIRNRDANARHVYGDTNFCVRVNTPPPNVIKTGISLITRILKSMWHHQSLA